MMKRRLFGWVGIWCLASAPALAQQRPLVTEDPQPVGVDLILLEAGVDYAWDRTFPVSGLQGNLLRGPRLGLSVGVGENAEVQIDGVSWSLLSIDRRFDAPLADMLRIDGDRASSFDDLVVGAKLRLVKETGRRPAVGLRFATKLPNAGNEAGLGLDTMDFFQSLLVAKTIRSVRFVGNVGVGILSDPTRGDRQNDVVTYGLSLARAVTEQAEMVAEINGHASTRRGTPPPGTETRATMTYGVRYTRGAIRFDAGVVAGLTTDESQVGLTGGLTWVFRSFLNR